MKTQIIILAIVFGLSPINKLSEAEKKFRQSKGQARKEAAKPYLDLLVKAAEAKTLAGKPEDALAMYRKGWPIARYAKYRTEEIQEDSAWAGKVLKAKTKGDKTAMEKLLSEPPSKRFGRMKTITLDLGKGVTMKLVRIPAGEFMIVIPRMENGRRAETGPKCKMTIDEPFYMGVTEVTQEQYEAIIGENPSHFEDKPKNPVDSISWYLATGFCEELSKKTGRNIRLPTEAEWEYACRAGSKTKFYFGNDEKQLDDHAWWEKNSRNKTHRVGQKKPNAWGLYDMYGNIWEWCKDQTLKGGSWHIYPTIFNSATAISTSAGRGVHSYGFRVIIIRKKTEK